MRNSSDYIFLQWVTKKDINFNKALTTFSNLLVLALLAREVQATGGGCWDSHSASTAASVTNAKYCKTTISTGVSVEVNTGVAGNDTLCCDIDFSGGSKCNQVSGNQCYDPSSAGAAVTCTLSTVPNGDFACGVRIDMLLYYMFIRVKVSHWNKKWKDFLLKKKTDQLAQLFTWVNLLLNGK